MTINSLPSLTFIVFSVSACFASASSEVDSPPLLRRRHQRTLMRHRQGPFQLRMHWQDGYKWQEDSSEQFYCWQCARCSESYECTTSGDLCEEGDNIVSEECDDDDNRQYLQFRPYDDGSTPGLGQFQFVETNLCLTMEKLGGRDFTLEACADTVKGEYNARQYFAGFNETNRFELYPNSDNTKCVTTHHQPRPDELIYHQPCEKARKSTTSQWVLWNPKCSSASPCGACEDGFCDSDSDCLGDLVCHSREGEEGVPGCSDVPFRGNESQCGLQDKQLRIIPDGDCSEGGCKECSGDW